jgi:hypothetical protein
MVTYLCGSQLSAVPCKFFRVFRGFRDHDFYPHQLETAAVTDSEQRNWLRVYYFSTPLFVLADSLLGLDFRISGLHTPGYRLAYYGFCMLCALVLWYRPRLSPLVGMGESSFNLAILMVSVMLPILRADLDGPGAYIGLQGANIINFILTGGVLLAAFYSAQRRLLQQR